MKELRGFQKELTEEEEREQEDQKDTILNKKVGVLLAGIGCLVYLVLWIVHWILPGTLWDWSVNSSESWSQVGAYWTVHFWIVKWFLYWWWFALISILLLIAPRRASSLKSLLFFFLSLFFHYHFSFFSGASRPIWLNPKIVLREDCACSFAMPAEESDIGFMLWAFLVYELVMHARHLTAAAKWTWIGVTAFITLNITLGRIFYGSHSIPQTFIGMFHGIFFFGIMIIFSQQITAFFRGFLDGARINQFILLGVAAFMLIFDFVIFYSYYNDSVRNYVIGVNRCQECTVDGNQAVRANLARNFAFVHMYFGIVVGLVAINPAYLGRNDFMIEDHLSLKGIFRILLIAALHLPLMFLWFFNFTPVTIFWYNTIFYVITGFLITFADILLNNKLGWNFKGDIIPKGSETSTGAEGQSLLDSKEPAKFTRGNHFNPYDKSADFKWNNPSQQQDYSGRRPPQ